jgi:hypothetical protein
VSRELDELLRTMPRERAPDGFAQGVLERLDRPTPRPHRWGLALAGAAVALLLVMGGATWWSRSTSNRALRAEIATLRQQHQELQGQLTDLRQRLAAREPLVVGGTDRVDYVVDLERLSNLAATGGSAQEAIWVPQPLGGSL